MKYLGYSELTKRLYILPASKRQQKIDITDDVNEYLQFINGKLSSLPPEGQNELWDNAADMIIACYNNLGSREELNVKLKSKYIISERK